ncbi:MAG: hypothetical protein ACRAS9_00725 [Mycoplasma sp.]
MKLNIHKLLNGYMILKWAGVIWSIVGLVCLILTYIGSQAVGVQFSQIQFIILIIFYVMWCFSYMNLNQNNFMMRFNFIFLAIDVFFSIYSTYISASTLFQISDMGGHIIYKIAAIAAISVTGLFLLATATFILLLKHGHKIMKMAIKNEMKRTTSVRLAKKSKIQVHNFTERILFIEIKNLYPSKYSQIYLAAIIAKVVPIDKLSSCQYLIVLNNKTIQKIYSFKEEKAIIIDQNNIVEINEHFQINLTNDDLNKFILNVTKLNVPTYLTELIGKEVDINNENEINFTF